MTDPSAPNAPLILTLTLDPEAQALFNALRQEHFPPARNYMQAHVTLFHHLPGPERAAVSATLAAVAAATPALPLAVTGVRFLGRGVAYSLANTELAALHRRLQATWAAWLTPQDQQPLRPHVTVQNKVEPAVARALHAQLAADFAPWEALGTGLTLWAYRGGPWEELERFRFSST